MQPFGRASVARHRSSSSYDQSIAARRVAWRSTAPRRPPASTLESAIESLEELRRCSSRSRGLLPVRWPSGTPSRRWQTSTTAAALPGVKCKSAFTWRVRSTNKRTASVLRRRSMSSSGSPDCHRRQGDQLLAVDPHSLPACGQHDHVLSIHVRCGSPVGRQDRGGARSCRGRSSSCLGRSAFRSASPPEASLRGWSAGAPPPPRSCHPRDRAPGPGRRTTPHRDTEVTRRPRPAMPSGSYRRRPHPVIVTTREFAQVRQRPSQLRPLAR